mmetsp:Transcript_101536/g.295928  ORF Transcript_101536/g.295928 Transcript_101536/m.295928 type:complete len:242 (+) Transcript_101536:1320-2045(+)
MIALREAVHGLLRSQVWVLAEVAAHDVDGWRGAVLVELSAELRRQPLGDVAGEGPLASNAEEFVDRGRRAAGLRGPQVLDEVQASGIHDRHARVRRRRLPHILALALLHAQDSPGHELHPRQERVCLRLRAVHLQEVLEALVGYRRVFLEVGVQRLREGLVPLVHASLAAIEHGDPLGRLAWALVDGPEVGERPKDCPAEAGTAHLDLIDWRSQAAVHAVDDFCSDHGVGKPAQEALPWQS